MACQVSLQKVRQLTHALKSVVRRTRVLSRLNQHGLAACTSPGFHILLLITDHPGAGKIKIVPARCLDQHARVRLPMRMPVIAR